MWWTWRQSFRWQARKAGKRNAKDKGSAMVLPVSCAMRARETRRNKIWKKSSDISKSVFIIEIHHLMDLCSDLNLKSLGEVSWCVTGQEQRSRRSKGPRCQKKQSDPYGTAWSLWRGTTLEFLQQPQPYTFCCWWLKSIQFLASSFFWGEKTIVKNVCHMKLNDS